MAQWLDRVHRALRLDSELFEEVEHDYSAGSQALLTVLAASACGGVGNLWGTLIGGLSLGIANKFMEPWAGAVMAKILILVFVILFIQKRPRGLFPQKGRAADV